MNIKAYILLMLSSTACAFNTDKPLKIAVVDSGLDITDTRLSEQLCPTGHKDFTGYGLVDSVGHGTFVTGLIEKYAGSGNYCLVIYKYYSPLVEPKTNLENEILAFKEAIKNGVNVINFSSGGPHFDKEEYTVIRNNPNVLFVVAAGNDGQNIDFEENSYYPASYFLKNEFVIGNITLDNQRAPTSNWSSRITEVEVGEDVCSTAPDHKIDCGSGTSYSTAIRTGKIIRSILNAK